MVSVKSLNFFLTVSCFLGIGLSIYSYLIELAAEDDKNYLAMCDISEHISCTKAFTSKYGKGFGIFGKLLGESSVLNKPNSLLGIMFYSILAIIGRAAIHKHIIISFKLVMFGFETFYLVWKTLHHQTSVLKSYLFRSIFFHEEIKTCLMNSSIVHSLEGLIADKEDQRVLQEHISDGYLYDQCYYEAMGEATQKLMKTEVVVVEQKKKL